MNDKEKQIERQKKLNELQNRHGELSREKEALSRETNKRLKDIKKELSQLGNAIYDLKHVDGDTPHITDHAIVRYLERVKGMDIWDLKAEIMNHTKAVRIDNVIVTVNPGEPDA